MVAMFIKSDFDEGVAGLEAVDEDVVGLVAESLEVFSTGRGEDTGVLELDEVAAFLILDDFPGELESLEGSEDVALCVVALEFQQLDVPHVDRPQFGEDFDFVHLLDLALDADLFALGLVAGGYPDDVLEALGTHQLHLHLVHTLLSPLFDPQNLRVRRRPLVAPVVRRHRSRDVPQCALFENLWQQQVQVRNLNTFKRGKGHKYLSGIGPFGTGSKPKQKTTRYSLAFLILNLVYF